jgi:hypothetical protein
VFTGLGLWGVNGGATTRRAAEERVRWVTSGLQVAAEAGAEAPADAMAVMKGEDAGGRFSYEWLFNQQEREQLKQSFKALANDNGEVQVRGVGFSPLPQLSCSCSAAHRAGSVLKAYVLKPHGWPASKPNQSILA